MIKGSIVALITPFKDNGEVDYKKIADLVNWHIKQGSDALLVLGTTAETPALTEKEQELILKIAVKESRGRIPIIASSGGNNTEKSVEKSIAYEEMGADALLVITPYYNKPNTSGMKAHFLKVADSVDIPIYIYNVPSRSGICISFDDVAELSSHKNIQGIKEASGDMSYAAKLSTLINDDFNIYSGNDDITIPLMSMGAAGVVSVWANLMPKEVHKMVWAYLDGYVDVAKKIQLDNLNLINALFCETNPVPVKEMMNMAGMDVGGCRLPLGPIGRYNSRVLKNLMKNIGKIKI